MMSGCCHTKLNMTSYDAIVMIYHMMIWSDDDIMMMRKCQTRQLISVYLRLMSGIVFLQRSALQITKLSVMYLFAYFLMLYSNIFLHLVNWIWLLVGAMSWDYHR